MTNAVLVEAVPHWRPGPGIKRRRALQDQLACGPVSSGRLQLRIRFRQFKPVRFSTSQTSIYRQGHFNSCMVLGKHHPTHEHFIVFKDGCIKRRAWLLGRKDSFIKGVPNKMSGYVLYSGKLVHRLVWETFMGRIPEGFQIHHKNADKTDNRLANLEMLTTPEHAKITGPTRVSNGASLPLVATSPFEIRRFPSYKAAAQSIPRCYTVRLTKMVNTGKVYRGYVWTSVHTHDDNEIWATPSNHAWRGLQASRSGLIKRRNGRLVQANKLCNGYRRFSVNNRSFAVHFVICTVFHGPQPSSCHTVDHIDRNALNNAADNLRWSTSIQQLRNTSHCVKVAACDIETGVMRHTWPTIVEAAEALDIPAANIRDASRLNNITHGMRWKRL